MNKIYQFLILLDIFFNYVESISKSFRTLKQLKIKYQLNVEYLHLMHGRRKLKKHLIKINITELYELFSHYQLMDQIVLFQLNKKLTKLLRNKDALTLGIQFINPDIKVVKEALIQIHEKRRWRKRRLELLINLRIQVLR